MTAVTASGVRDLIAGSLQTDFAVLDEKECKIRNSVRNHGSVGN